MAKGFRKWMGENPNAKHLGKVAVFYIPTKKVDEKIRNSIHDFFVHNHGAYTHDSGDIKGYWMDGGILARDSHERYEISFRGQSNFKNLVVFLSELCLEINEKSIYMTFAGESYLIS